ncbi:hypothetical protein SAMN04487866_12134 [Thermoactinomyces sp. DSM 45891]|uniref:hypothetical protein n=1 Tax=Thermoactinomyces sp. DSM 45891 TaxID=1761907 RepID=UPI000914B41F|nr:hypothetical protein [Thermoactinomyces sp. DSM 45891]SFX74050.1 hypothetical protein SAMN04487866_12134 [Thermoactinomyces sp. DSM 45891]
MSVESSIDFQLVYRDSTKMVLFQSLMSNGWKYHDEFGKVFYLPVGDIDDYDWQREKMSLDQLQELVQRKIDQNEVIGITITWEDTDVGGDFLIWPDGNCSFMVNKNRKILIDRITDISWYLSKLVPAINSRGIRLIEYKVSEM